MCFFSFLFVPPSGRNLLRDALSADTTAQVRRRPQPGAGQHPADRSPDRPVHLQHLHHHRWTLHDREEHGAGTDHGAGVSPADDVPDNVRARRVATLVRDARADPS